MMVVPAGVKVHLALGYTDMRKGMDGLAALVQEQLKQDPFSGHLFVFLGRRRDKVKILYWDRSGFSLLYKRLEQGTFCMPERGEIGARELLMVLEGLDAVEVRPRRWYQRRV